MTQARIIQEEGKFSGQGNVQTTVSNAISGQVGLGWTRKVGEQSMRSKPFFHE